MSSAQSASRAPRPLLAALPCAFVVAWAWSLLEAPSARPAFALIAALALVPAAVGRRSLRLVTVATVGIAGLCLAFAEWPRPAVRLAWEALHDAPAVRSPFDPTGQPGIHGLVLLATLGIVLVAAVSRRPLVGATATVAGLVWPATVLEGRYGLALGCAGLAAALWFPLVRGAPSVRGALPGVACLAALVAVSGAVASTGNPGPSRIDWRGWDPFGGARARVGVRYVWDADYRGIEFPTRATVVLRIKAPKRSLYWRASTLDLFVKDRWIENVYPLAVGEPRRLLPADPLLPAAAANPANWVEQTVTVVSLAEERLLGATQPMRVDAPGISRVLYQSGGVIREIRAIRRGQRYRIWSYAPRPTPQRLLSSEARYPKAIRRYLELGNTDFPQFGAPARAAAIERVFADDRYRPIWDYEPLWRRARSLTRTARSPYEATVAIERWLRTTGGFVYDEQPPLPRTLPPLVDFVTRTRAGYCQQYAGTMALMLRMTGIPARVAVGFTSGTWRGGTWTVTDRQAHAWVEAWFDGFGWLTFDPTPGRGTLSVAYTLASDSADAVRALGTGRFLDFTPDPTVPTAIAESPSEGERRVSWWLLTVPGAPLLAAAAVLVAKGLRRRRRLGASDPRRLAEGLAAELVDALRDSGVRVPPASGVLELRRVVERTLGPREAAIADSLGRARYGPPPAAETAARRARTELTVIRQALGVRHGRLGRLRLALAPASLRRGGTGP